MKKLMFVGLSVILVVLQAPVMAVEMNCEEGVVSPTSMGFDVIKPRMWEDDSNQVLKGHPFLLQWSDPDNDLGPKVTIARVKVDNGRTNVAAIQWLNNQPNTGWALLTRAMTEPAINFADKDQLWTYMVQGTQDRSYEIYSPCFTYNDELEMFGSSLDANEQNEKGNKAKNRFRYYAEQIFPVLCELGGNEWVVEVARAPFEVYKYGETFFNASSIGWLHIDGGIGSACNLVAIDETPI